MTWRKDELWGFRVKRTITLWSYVLQSFVHGISFFIFPPILAGYLRDIHSDHVGLYEGLIFALEPIVGSIAAVGLGRLCDKTRRARLILVILQLSQVIGNLFYSIRLTEWTIVIGKVFCGLGEEAFFSVSTGELATCYYGKAEGWALLLLTMGFALGMAVGPLLNFLFRSVSFSIGPFMFNSYNTPGLFVAGLHLIVAIVCMFTIFDMSVLSAQYRLLRKNRSGTLSLTGSETDSDLESEYDYSSGKILASQHTSTCHVMMALLSKRPIGTLMLMSFLFMTLTMMSMTLIPLAGTSMLHLDVLDIVASFSLAGTMSVVGNLFVYCMPCSFRMGHILVLSIVFLLFQTACIFLVSLDVALPSTARAVFFLWSSLHGLTFILCDLICRTMVAISTPRGHRSLAEGLRQVAVCMGFFIGGILAGCLFNNPILLAMIMLSIVLSTFILFTIESQRLLQL